MTKPVIANVMLGINLGGIEQATVDYSEALKLAGYEVIAIIDPDAAIQDALAKSGVPFMTMKNMGAWDILAILKLRFMLKKIKAGVCIAHGNRALTLLKHAVRGQKLIAVAHNYKINLDDTSTVFCPTRDLMRYAESQGVGKHHTYHISNMVRTKPPFLQPPYEQRECRQVPVIGAMGRFVAKKGFSVFLESLAKLKSSGVTFRAVLAGTGEEEQNLKSLAAILGLGDIVSFPGWIEDKYEFFAGIDIFCLPSLHEPFGIVLLEAMVNGVPVIATASEGPSEIIANGVDGVLVEKSNADQMAICIKQLIDEPLKYRRLSKNARDTVYNHYDLSVISKKMEDALNSIMAR